MDRDEESLYDEGAAAVAHSRWPTIGLFTGAGIGFALGILFVAQWFLTILYIIVCGCLGCLCGFLAATIIYHKQS